MKTILEIQKLDRQIRQLNREVEKCPASIDFKNYKKILQEGRARFEQLENQANEILKNYNSALCHILHPFLKNTYQVIIQQLFEFVK